MLQRATPLIGRDVITLDSGQKVETVSDVLYDAESKKVLGLVIDKAGWFKDAKVLLFSDIESIGKDAIMISSSKLVKKAADVPINVATIARNDKRLTQTKIMTEDGKELGTVSDIYFDDQTGQVSELEVSQGLKDAGSGKKRIPVTAIVNTGQDVTIVRPMVEETLEQQPPTGGVQKMAQQVQQKAGEVVGQAKQKVEEVTKDPSTQEKVDATKQQAHTVYEQANTKVTEVNDKVSEKVKQIQDNPKVQKATQETKGVLQDIGTIISSKAQEARDALHQEAQKAEQEKK
jgi:uncharacterized protein YrrD